MPRITLRMMPSCSRRCSAESIVERAPRSAKSTWEKAHPLPFPYILLSIFCSMACCIRTRLPLQEKIAYFSCNTKVPEGRDRTPPEPLADFFDGFSKRQEKLQGLDILFNTTVLLCCAISDDAGRGFPTWHPRSDLARDLCGARDQPTPR